ncbi:MAG: uroporphyrinogen decarboxylase family protein [candidate division Zixibacteria bacterium]
MARFGLDAAILFSDILTMLEPMGAGFDFPDGGPRLAEPIDTPEAVDRLHDFDIDEHLSFVFEGIREIKKILPDTPLIGFVGSPFTVASYLIEGQGSKHFDKAKRFLHQYPESSDKLLGLLADVAGRYLKAQIDAGVDTVQVFDSWGGVLSIDAYKRFSAAPVNRIFSHLASAGVPRILFVNNIAPYLDIVRDIDCEVLGVDYRTDIARVADAIPNKALQGNLDPSILFGPIDKVREKTKAILDSVSDKNRFIFNLGHGIQPKTPIEAVAAVVETVHNYRA